MRFRVAVVAVMILSSCVRKPPDGYAYQDRSIKMPKFDGSTKIDVILDGPTVEALRMATEDYLPPSSNPRPCLQTRSAQKYEVSYGNNVIFVRIERNPKACGGHGLGLDGAVRYAISADGRILRRIADLEPEELVPGDAGAHQVVDLPVRPDGLPILGTDSKLDESHLPPWLLDGGTRERP